MKLQSLIVTAALVLGSATLTAAPAQAAMIDGQLDITGVVNVQTSDFMPGGALDFEGNGNVIIATGDFAGLLGSSASLFDLAFSAPELVYSVGGFSFTAIGYFGFDNDLPGRGFAANGVLTAVGYDDTPGLLTLSTQSNNSDQLMASFSSSTTATPVPLPASALLLLGALGGLGFVSRRRNAAVA